MEGFIARQPNGLLCRHSTVTDCITDYNMPDDDYINLCKKRAEDEAREELKGSVKPFSRVIDEFAPNNMDQERFQQVLKEMERPVETCRHIQT